MSSAGVSALHSLQLLLFFLPSCLTHTYSEFSRLRGDLLENYDHRIRPVHDHKSTVFISVGLYLLSLLELDEVSQTISLSSYFIFSWTDEKLTWNPTNYSSVSSINFNTDEIWLPHMAELNSLDRNPVNLMDLRQPVPVTVTHSGKVTLAIPVVLHTTCPMVMTHFPKDDHTCTICIYVNGYTEDEVSMESNKNYDARQMWHTDGEWELVSYSLPKQMKIVYGNKAAFCIEVTFRRFATFFVLNLLSPIIMMSFLNILVFILPVASGEKVGYAITVLLAMLVFMTAVADELPPTSTHVPLVTKFLAGLTAISILSVIATVFVLMVHHNILEKGREKHVSTKTIQHALEKSSSDDKSDGSMIRYPGHFSRSVSNRSWCPLYIHDNEQNNNQQNSPSVKPETLQPCLSKTIQRHQSILQSRQSGQINNNQNISCELQVRSGTCDACCQTSDCDEPYNKPKSQRSFIKTLDLCLFYIFLSVWTINTLTFLILIFS